MKFWQRLSDTPLIPLILFGALGLLVTTVATHSQSPQLQWVERLPDGSAIIKIDGIEHRAMTQAQVDKIALNKKQFDETSADLNTCRGLVTQTQSDLAKEKQNVQDERLEKAKIHQMYDENQVYLKQCFGLLKQGGGRVGHWLDNPFFRIGEDVTKTAIQMRRCH